MRPEPEPRPGNIREIVAPAPGELPRRVTVVVPALDEAEHIARGIEELETVLHATDWEFEVVVVDDGSSDGTGERAAEAGARVLRHWHNLGYGAALTRGIRSARHDWILIIDADGTYPPAAVPSLLAAAPGSDMVVGVRTGSHVEVPWLRRPAKWFLNRLASYLAGRSLPDVNSGLRLMRRDFVERYTHILPSGFSFTTTITLAAACNQHEMRFVPIDYLARLGRSKIRAAHALDFTLLILRTIVFFNPLKVFIPLGALFAVAGLAKFVYDVTQDDLSESAIFGMLGALIVWSLGLLADQNARLLQQR